MAFHVLSRAANGHLRGGVAAWTMPSAVTAKLAAKAEKVVSAPKITAYSEARASISTKKTVNMVNSVDRQADGPVNHASLVAFRPKVEGQVDGDSIQLSGRKLDQGILTQVEIDDRQITTVHKVRLSEDYEHDKQIVDGDKVTLSMVLQVPEIVHAHVSGEWLVPNHGTLVVSLGVHTSADAKGKAVVHERLAIIEARAVGDPTTQKVTFAPIYTPGPAASIKKSSQAEQDREFNMLSYMQQIYGGVVTADGAVIPMPAPVVPSRALPQGVNAAGIAVALPPLPEDAEPPTTLPDSAEACATPQIKGEPIGDPIPPRSVRVTGRGNTDSDRNRADVDAVRVATRATSALPDAGRRQSKEVNFRIPVNNDLMIEVRASARGVQDANVPPPPVQPAQ